MTNIGDKINVLIDGELESFEIALLPKPPEVAATGSERNFEGVTFYSSITDVVGIDMGGELQYVGKPSVSDWNTHRTVFQETPRLLYLQPFSLPNWNNTEISKKMVEETKINTLDPRYHHLSDISKTDLVSRICSMLDNGESELKTRLQYAMNYWEKNN